jgi:hypothetical protein
MLRLSHLLRSGGMEKDLCEFTVVINKPEDLEKDQEEIHVGWKEKLLYRSISVYRCVSIRQSRSAPQ